MKVFAHVVVFMSSATVKQLKTDRRTDLDSVGPSVGPGDGPDI